MNGVEVGFVGAVTEHLPELVSPAGIADIQVTDIVEAVNDEADELKADGADLVDHARARGCRRHQLRRRWTTTRRPTSAASSPGSTPTSTPSSPGHTHLEYNCDFTVQDWVDEGRTVTKRPVVSAGQYGAALNQIVFDVNPGTGEVLAKRQAVLKLKVANGGPFNYPVDAPTQAIVDAAVANANVLGAAAARPDGGRLPAGQVRPTARRRTAAASRRSATWSPRPSAGPPATRSRARRRSRS